MQTRLQIGVDGSEPALAAVSYVGIIAADVPHLFVRLLHVVPTAPTWLQESGHTYEPFGGGYVMRFPEHVAAWRTSQADKAKDLIERARALLIGYGVSARRIETAIEEGASHRPSREIRVSAEQNGCGTIVVGRRGVSLLRQFAFGGVTEDLLRYPIGRHLWIIEPPASTTGMRDVLVGVDGSPNGDRAVEYTASMLGPKSGFSVTLAHVPRRRTPEGAQRILDVAYDRLVNKGFDRAQIATKILDASMKTADALMKEARGNDQRTIVIGRRGRSTLREFIFGGVTERLLRYPIGQSVWVVD